MTFPAASPAPSAPQNGEVLVPTTLVRVDHAQAGLSICGQSIEDLARHATFEETCYLLWNRRLPSTLELEGHVREMAEDRTLPKPVLDLLWSFPREIRPMVGVRSAISTLGAFDPDAEGETLEDNARKALRITSQLSTVIASWARIRNDEEPVNADTERSHAADLLGMLTGETPVPALAHLFERILILYSEHGIDTPTAAARLTASTHSDMHAAVTSALGTAGAPLQAGAVQGVMETLLRIGSPAGIRSFVLKSLSRDEYVVGFGKSGFPGGDPRVVLLRQVAADLAQATGDHLWYEMALETQQVVEQERPELQPTIDLFAAPALYALGFAPDLMNTVLCAGRVAGWTAHVLEQRTEKPRFEFAGTYQGEAPKTWVPLEER